MKQAVKHLGLPKAPVNAVTKLRREAGQMFLAYAMMDAADIPFHVGDQGMYPGEQLHGLRKTTWSKDCWSYETPCRPSVRLDSRKSCNDISGVSGGNRPLHGGSEDTGSPPATAGETTVFDRLFRYQTSSEIASS